MRNERLFYLDFIRALSLIFIVIYHYNLHLRFHHVNGPFIFRFFPNDFFAYIGVSLFIIISGAALMYTYQNQFKIKDFFIRRFLSLYPLFWTGYVIAFLYVFFMNKSINHSAPKWTLLLTFIGMDGYFGYIVRTLPNFYLVGEWFLGFIIFFYLVFPILRYVFVKFPNGTIIFTVILYLLAIKLFPQGTYANPFGRLPEFVFGMFFVSYIKKINVYSFLIALAVVLLVVYSKINMIDQFKVTIVGISSFIVLSYIANYITNVKIKEVFSFISKYSFASIIANQQVMIVVMLSFGWHTITPIESYLLFLIVLIVIHTIAVFIYKLSRYFIEYFQ